MRRILTALVLALLAAGSAAFGQAQHGNVQIKVTDSDGAVLPGATVSTASDESLTRRSTITDSQGQAILISLAPAANYVVSVSLDGFAGARLEGVTVRAGQTTTLEAELQLADFSEELIVTAESPLVDVTKTQAGQDITLQLTESLPTSRSYQDYLQLVPGVQDALGSTENPASRSGVNYRDGDGASGDVGRSTDNLYYFDGINVTDHTTGTNGANLNTEIIQEQSVLTGAIPAEFVGAPGLISNVVTKSGGNEFSGSVNYYLQSDSFVEDNDHFAEESFSTFDAAVTFGGPILRDKAWFFASFRQTEEERDVINEEDAFLRTVTDESDQAFAKITWSITDSDVLSGTFLSDPTDVSGSSLRSTLNNADSSATQGGERFSLAYNRVWGAAVLEVAVTDHEAEFNVDPKSLAAGNRVSFAPGVPFGSADELVGGAGLTFLDNRGVEAQRASFEYLLDTGWGDHALKFGVTNSESTLIENENISQGARFISLSSTGSVRLCEILGACGSSTSSWSTADFGTSSDEVQNFRENLTSGQRSTLLGLWDDNSNGALDSEEIRNNMTFGSTDGNPNGLINYTRDFQVTSEENVKGSEAVHVYLQDSWQ